MGDVKDIFTKKNLADVQSEKDMQDDLEAEVLGLTLTEVLSAVQSQVDAKEVTGLFIAASTKGGVIVPHIVLSDEASALKLNLLADEIKARIVESCSEAFGLLSFSEDEWEE